MSTKRDVLRNDLRLGGSPRLLGRVRALRVEPLEVRAMLAAFFVDADLGDDLAAPDNPQIPFETIQAALDQAAATEGPDMVILTPDEYHENVVIDDPDAVTLQGKGSTLVAAESDDDVIEILAGDVTIRQVTVTGGDNGIAAEGDETIDSLTLVDVAATGNEDRGLDADDISAVRIVHGNFSENGGDGIKVEDAQSLDIVGGNYSDNDSDGLDLEAIAAVRIVHGDVSGNDGDGIKVEDAQSVDIVGGNYSDNDSDGLDLEEIAAIRVRNAVVNGNGDEGLEVDDSGSVQVSGGQYSGNADDGLDIDNSQEIRVNNVVATGNGGNGLQIEADVDIQSVSVVNGIFSGNAEYGIQIVEAEDDQGDPIATIHNVSVTNVTLMENTDGPLDVKTSGKQRLRNIKT